LGPDRRTRSSRMERTFYEDPPGASSSSSSLQKTSMTLDLGPLRTGDLGPLRTGDLLTSPDVGLLKLGSPELERLIIQSGLVTITPTPTLTPTRVLCPRTVTDEQEGFAEGFVRALAELHHQHMPPGTSGGSRGSTSGAGSGSPLYEDLGTLGTGYSSSSFWFSAAPQPPGFRSGPVLKEEPQTVPEMPGETPPLSPIDMERQERIKAERKKMRNRIAASKCRKRKLERISRLEDKVKNLKGQNSELSSTANLLRDQVARLKQKVMDHVTSGCQLMLTQQLQTF